MGGKFKFAIDRGGTFTDIYAICPNGQERVLKLLSVDPTNYEDAPTEGIRRILSQECNRKIPPDEPIDCSNIEWIRMGTTVATNALLERKGERMALLITKGFKDLLSIGNQARPNIFDLEIVTRDVIYDEVIEVDGRVVPSLQEICKMPENTWYGRVVGSTNESLNVYKPLEKIELRNKLVELKERGINSIAVVLMHSYTYIDDEVQVGLIAKEVGFDHVSLSHEVMQMIRIVPRGYTACIDAYLTPCIQKYIQSFASGFKDNLNGVNVLFMQSDGGLTSMNSFIGSRAILSGPAAGVVGYATTTFKGKAVIGFDMGGTSTDVSRYDGNYEHVFETTIAGLTIQAPQLDVNTVAAGGGSRLFFRSGMFVVGPESASAHPGPICYRKSGYLTVTDANLLLGRILPEFFPHIFGEDEKQPLDKDATILAFEQLTEKINHYQRGCGKNALTIEEVAMGFIKVANESMCRPIRALTQAKGYDTRNHVLACFGGAGAQHACAISKSLGIRTVSIHKYAGILSAYGMACANVVQEKQEPCALSYASENFVHFEERISVLIEDCIKQLEIQGFIRSRIEVEPYLHLRYEGTDYPLMCPAHQPSAKTKYGDFEYTFIERYKNEFGFTLSDRKILVDDIRVRGIGKAIDMSATLTSNEGIDTKITKMTKVYFEDIGYMDTAVYLLKTLPKNFNINGPAIIIDELSTIIIEPNCATFAEEHGNIQINVDACGDVSVTDQLDSIQLSIFSHRFMSIAEQMGRVLQRTSISTNIRERLDFSCALFGPDGGLVSNAPHIPVHLGAMQETVQWQMNNIGDLLQKGDVILSNHPKAGGSHLPDLTVITPVFYKDLKKPIFFVASRGHHADIGGITPGSMPPHSNSIYEEGASFKSFFLVKRGVFCEEEVTKALQAPGDLPGCSGTRNLSDNLADLKAQIAANQRGISLVVELIEYYGLHVVQSYMNYIQQNAETAVKDMMRDIGRNTGNYEFTGIDYMDDGSTLNLKVIINPEDGTAIFDFTGTSHEVWGNCNAPRAITMSALIYCLRSMVGHDVPLNQGCLAPIKVIVPEGSILDPSEDAAVVGGNVQTSQRIVDVIFKAFGTVAASQGCMNNITFGQENWGYYETVAGGAGAGPRWNGKSGVHTHMTNTRITDPEILERRYPVILDQFSLRDGSGGEGKFRGGNGVERKITFRAPVTLSILTERRVFEPYGVQGGKPGKRGENLLIKRNGRIIRLPSKTIAKMDPGDTFYLLTPGGGGYGKKNELKSELKNDEDDKKFIERGSVHEYRMQQESV